MDKKIRPAHEQIQELTVAKVHVVASDLAAGAILLDEGQDENSISLSSKQTTRSAGLPTSRRTRSILTVPHAATTDTLLPSKLSGFLIRPSSRAA